jgi:hypothetical protein
MNATKQGDQMVMANKLPILIRNVLTVPTTRQPLLSVGPFGKTGHYSYFNNEGAHVFDAKTSAIINQYMKTIIYITEFIR